MAMLNLHIQSRPSFFTHLKPKCTSSSTLRHRHVVCTAIQRDPSLESDHVDGISTIVRRTANYPPSIWDFDFLQSLKTEYNGEIYDRRAKNLKENLRNLFIDEDMEWLSRLELIDSLQRLGLGYLFDEEVKTVLETIANRNNNISSEKSLHAVALRFRLLRQHGYEISQDVFGSFMHKRGTYKESLCEDIKGMLSLYEASHLAMEGENNLDEAKDFTITHLKNIKKPIDPNLVKLVKHSLELPLQWRMPRLEARWYIDECIMNGDIDPRLLELAKLDFNMVQAAHQNDLREISRWWKKLGLVTKLSFARDRSVESFLWTIGTIPHSQFGTGRRGLTKVNCLITIIDDVYDVYGTLEELKLFTDAVERWEINAMEQLPHYMKMCFLALYNTVNKLAYDTLKEHGLNILPYLQKAWLDLCKAYFAEANWYYSKYTPTLQEYLNNACISIAGPLMLLHIYFLIEKEITTEALNCLENYPDIIRYSSVILRLSDDLGTSKAELERGDVPKSIQCYMHETGVSENIAREHIKQLINDTWKKMNKHRVTNSPFSQYFIEAIVNQARTAQCMYEFEDGHGVPDGKTKDRIMSLLVEPISLVQT